MDDPLDPGCALLDGRLVALPEARLAITDDGASRGDGAFETVGVWGGQAFRLPDHLQRLAASSRAIGLAEPDGDLLAAEADRLLGLLRDRRGAADAVLRLYWTGSGTRLVLLSPQPVRPPVERLSSQPAPWIRPVGTYGPAGAKTMSYGPNMAATRAAVRAGADDALLVALEGWVLEGPTFAVLWAVDGVLHAPEIGLGVVDSISRRAVLELAADLPLEVREGRWPLEAVADADEVLVVSSVRDVLAVSAVDGWGYGPASPVRDHLSAALHAARRGTRGG